MGSGETEKENFSKTLLCNLCEPASIFSEVEKLQNAIYTKDNRGERQKIKMKILSYKTNRRKHEWIFHTS